VIDAYNGCKSLSICQWFAKVWDCRGALKIFCGHRKQIP